MATMTSSLTGTIEQQQQAVDIRPFLRAVAKAEIWQGVKLLAIGTVITVGTYMIAPGGLFLISFAPIYGVYHMLHGLYKLAAV